MTLRFASLILLGFILLTSCSTKKEKESVDLAFVNGRVWTGSDSLQFVEAIAITGNKIAHIGTSDEINQIVDEKTKVIDLRGQLVVPGFNDAHIHFLSGSVGLNEVDLTGAGTIDEVVRRIKKFAAENPSKQWITGRGWQYTMFSGGLPSREILDSALRDRAVFIKAYDGHSAWANSAALRLAGISRSTEYKQFGEMVRAKNGEPTGVFKEGAMELVGDKIPPLTTDEKLDALRKGLKLAASLGITSMANASGSPEELSLYKRLLDSGELTVRMVAAFSVGDYTIREDIHRYAFLKDSVGTSARLSANAVKFMLDGVIESHTAGMLAPYSNLNPKETLPTGSLTMQVDRYQFFVREFDSLGFRIYTHAIGDRAVREALNAYEQAAKSNGTTARHRIEHIETISPDDLPRFAALSVLPSMEPIHAEPGTVSVWAEGVGAKRLPYSHLPGTRSLLEEDTWCLVVTGLRV
jgi:predicted amidohydrolase YtcJ